MVELTSFKAEYIDDAAHLLADAYRAEQSAQPRLPELNALGNGRGIDHIRTHLHKSSTGIGVAAFTNGNLSGFMLESMRFNWKGQATTLCDELSHAVEGVNGNERTLLYRTLYQALAQQWVEDGQHLHIVRHLAHDAMLKETLYLLGFGAILAENLRGMMPIGSATERHVDGLEIRENSEPSSLVALQQEHSRYYQKSPIFASKDDSATAILADLTVHLANGDRIFTCVEHGEIIALLIIGESSMEDEGLLLRQTNTAQVKSAYIRPTARNKGIGSALLERSITWARAQGYDRLFVEHETANTPGSRFWEKYFTPFVYASLRYVDNTL